MFHKAAPKRDVMYYRRKQRGILQTDTGKFSPRKEGHSMTRRFAAITGIALATAASIALINPAWAEIDHGEMQAALQALHAHQAELAELARERAERDEVAQLASTLERDHGLLDEWLQNARESDDMAPEQGGAIHNSEAYAALQELEGAVFDEAYLDYQIELHTAAINFLEQNRSQADEQLDELNNHLLITHQTLLVNGELIDSLR